MKLTEKSFFIYAAKCFNMERAETQEEFEEELKRIQYLKRLFRRYEETGELKTRLILNHIIIIYNCFGLGATEMLFMKLPLYHEQLKSFLLLLNYMPERIEYEDVVIYSKDINIDLKVTRELSKLQ